MNTLDAVIKEKWRLIKKINSGSFGDIYLAKKIDDDSLVAVKLEYVNPKKKNLNIEINALRNLQVCEKVCRFITCGRHHNHNYIVMELLGDNLSQLRRKVPPQTPYPHLHNHNNAQQSTQDLAQAAKYFLEAYAHEGEIPWCEALEEIRRTGVYASQRFSLLTTLKLALQIIPTLREIHDLGYIHRDLKPANFAMGRGEKKSQCIVIDFGLVYKYLGPNGEPKARRDKIGFRGTPRYASVHAHVGHDLSPRDDFWSLFYMMLEFMHGDLPWRFIRDRDQIGDMKLTYLRSRSLIENLPEEMGLFMAHLQVLRFDQRPDYDFIMSLFTSLYESCGGDEATPFDWDAPLERPPRDTRKGPKNSSPSLLNEDWETRNASRQSPQSPYASGKRVKIQPEFIISPNRHVISKRNVSRSELVHSGHESQTTGMASSWLCSLAWRRAHCILLVAF
eukprot:TRINITY_DN601_c0_g1_i3.p1 TRINITY_DN601_c0_g1~~TRINITY_DN601_c0_g1_i3.p1  ORF type:complete len:448 (-),score=76.55 TRINITY_DN601_c0_g1_i3:475-1818(-)